MRKSSVPLHPRATRAKFVPYSNNANIGRRTGIDVRAGKTITKDADGYENISDYWSEASSDVDDFQMFEKWKKAQGTTDSFKVDKSARTMSPFTPSSCTSTPSDTCTPQTTQQNRGDSTEQAPEGSPQSPVVTPVVEVVAGCHADNLCQDGGPNGSLTNHCMEVPNSVLHKYCTRTRLEYTRSSIESETARESLKHSVEAVQRGRMSSSEVATDDETISPRTEQKCQLSPNKSSIEPLVEDDEENKMTDEAETVANIKQPELAVAQQSRLSSGNTTNPEQTCLLTAQEQTLTSGKPENTAINGTYSVREPHGDRNINGTYSVHEPQEDKNINGTYSVHEQHGDASPVNSTEEAANQVQMPCEPSIHHSADMVDKTEIETAEHTTETMVNSGRVNVTETIAEPSSVSVHPEQCPMNATVTITKSTAVEPTNSPSDVVEAVQSHSQTHENCIEQGNEKMPPLVETAEVQLNTAQTLARNKSENRAPFVEPAEVQLNTTQTLTRNKSENARPAQVSPISDSSVQDQDSTPETMNKTSRGKNKTHVAEAIEGKTETSKKQPVRRSLRQKNRKDSLEVTPFQAQERCNGEMSRCQTSSQVDKVSPQPPRKRSTKKKSLVPESDIDDEAPRTKDRKRMSRKTAASKRSNGGDALVSDSQESSPVFVTKVDRHDEQTLKNNAVDVVSSPGKKTIPSRFRNESLQDSVDSQSTGNLVTSSQKTVAEQKSPEKAALLSDCPTAESPFSSPDKAEIFSDKSPEKPSRKNDHILVLSPPSSLSNSGYVQPCFISLQKNKKSASHYILTDSDSDLDDFEIDGNELRSVFSMKKLKHKSPVSSSLSQPKCRKVLSDLVNASVDSSASRWELKGSYAGSTPVSRKHKVTSSKVQKARKGKKTVNKKSMKQAAPRDSIALSPPKATEKASVSERVEEASSNVADSSLNQRPSAGTRLAHNENTNESSANLPQADASYEEEPCDDHVANSQQPSAGSRLEPEADESTLIMRRPSAATRVESYEDTSEPSMNAHHASAASRQDQHEELSDSSIKTRRPSSRPRPESYEDSTDSIVHIRKPSAATRLESYEEQISSTQQPSAACFTPPTITRRKKCSKAVTPVVAVSNQKSQRAASKGLKKRKSVRMSTMVLEHKYDVMSPSICRGTPSVKSRKNLSQSDTGSSLVHFYQVTADPTLIDQHLSDSPRIVVPSTPAQGLRRSRRTKVKPLRWYMNERIKYKRKSGGLVVDGIESPPPDDDDKMGKVEKKVRSEMIRQKAKATRRKNLLATPRNLSVHVRDKLEDQESDLVPVINPDTGCEVLVECQKRRKNYVFMGPTGAASMPNDPIAITKPVREPGFSTGMLRLRGLQEKGQQYVQNDTMVFHVIRGKLSVTIHRTTSTLETHDCFFIPRGNTYNIRNLRDEEATLSFVLMKDT